MVAPLALHWPGPLIDPRAHLGVRRAVARVGPGTVRLPGHTGLRVQVHSVPVEHTQHTRHVRAHTSGGARQQGSTPGAESRAAGLVSAIDSVRQWCGYARARHAPLIMVRCCTPPAPWVACPALHGRCWQHAHQKVHSAPASVARHVAARPAAQVPVLVPAGCHMSRQSMPQTRGDTERASTRGGGGGAGRQARQGTGSARRAERPGAQVRETLHKTVRVYAGAGARGARVRPSQRQTCACIRARANSASPVVPAHMPMRSPRAPRQSQCGPHSRGGGARADAA